MKYCLVLHSHIGGGGSDGFRSAVYLRLKSRLLSLPCTFVMCYLYRHPGQRSKARKLQYIAELEKAVNSFQVNIFTSQVHYLLISIVRNYFLLQ